MLIINDVHVGFNRVGGTTPASRETLRNYLLDSLSGLIEGTSESETMVLGDLFDDFDVSNRDLVAAYAVFEHYLSKGKKLILVAGNHDHSPRAEKVSAFQVLCRILRDSFHDQVTLVMIDAWASIGDNGYVLAHCSNQETFDQRLTELLKEMEFGGTLFLHANFDNNFTLQSDHSLNVSREMAARFHAQGVKLVFAHEHQARTEMDGEVVVLGNQWPTSVSDCLNNPGGEKYAHTWDGETLTKIRTWEAADPRWGFANIDWQEIGNRAALTGFIRVTGTATSDQSSAVVNAIAELRRTSPAFVITNAVKVDGIGDIEKLPEQFEAARSFDVLNFIGQHMDQDQMKLIEELMKED